MAKLTEENQLPKAGPIEAEAGDCHDFLRKTRLLVAGGLFIALCAACAVDGRDAQRAPAPPTAREVEATLEQDYRAPERHTVTEVKEEGAGQRVAQRKDVVIWMRHFDGIQLLAEPRTVLVDGQRWETRRYRELAEPEPARLAEVISAETAAERAELREPGKATTRLVYKPEFLEILKVAKFQNAEDVETVIAKYRLAVEVVDHGGHGIVWVDAYSGEVISKAPLVRNLKVIVPGRHYPSVHLDVTPRGGLNLLADPVRYSLLGSSGQPLKGQGVVKGTPNNTTGPLDYRDTSTADPALIDGAFALEQSWEFFARAFGRRGLRDQARSTSSNKNEAIIYLNPLNTVLNAGMLFEVVETESGAFGIANGLVEINTGHPNWRSIMNLEVIGHEWGHSLFNTDVNHYFDPLGEQAGLDEATSDLFAKLIGMRGRAVLALQQCSGILCPDTVPPFVEIPNTAAGWVIFNEDPTTPAGLAYSMCRPSRIGRTAFHLQMLDEAVLGTGGMDGHQLRGPINRMHCLLARGILPNLSFSGDPDLKTPLVPEGFTGLGSEQAARIWYQALSFMHLYMAPVTFKNARQASLDAATALYGKYSAQYKAVEDAFAAIRVGRRAERTPPTITFTSKQLSRTNAEVVVDITDPDGLQPGTVVITSSVNPDVTIAQPCAGDHCVVTVDPAELGHGTHTVSVTATDVQNNTVTQIFNLSIDLKGPVVHLTDLALQTQEPYAYNRQFSGSASDPSLVASAKLRLVGGALVQAWTFSAPSVTVPATWVLMKDLPDGFHLVDLSATDTLGNSNERGSLFFRERVPPSVCTLIATVDPSDWRRVNLVMTSSDFRSAIDKLEVYVDSHFVSAFLINSLPSEVVSRSKKTAALPEGEHRIVVKCIDGQMNAVNSPERTVFLAPPCNTTATAGGSPVSTKTFSMGAGSGTVQLIFRTFGVHDRMRVMGANNAVVADTGCAATGDGHRSQSLTFSGTSSLTVRVDPNCDPVTAAPTTEWDYRLTCP